MRALVATVVIVALACVVTEAAQTGDAAVLQQAPDTDCDDVGGLPTEQENTGHPIKVNETMPPIPQPVTPRIAEEGCDPEATESLVSDDAPEVIIPGGAPVILPAAVDAAEALPVTGRAKNATGAAAKVPYSPYEQPKPSTPVSENYEALFGATDVEPPRDLRIPVLEEAKVREKAALMRRFLRDALPAMDDEGIYYEEKQAPKPPPTEEAGLITDVPAVLARRGPAEGAAHHQMPVVRTSKVAGMNAMPDVEEDEVETELPCNTCPGHPYNTCSLHGKCINGTCECHYGYRGDDCSIRICPGVQVECSGHGTCVNGSCVCDDYFTTFDCSKPVPRCPSPGYGLPECSGEEHGTCDRHSGVCSCFFPWHHEDCAVMRCPGEPECSNHGTCWYGTCLCDKPYMGHDCSHMACPGTPQCGGHGSCVNGSCVCAPNWKGEDCSEFRCPGTPECNGHGLCDSGVCNCSSLWRGTDCSIPHCPTGSSGSECSDHGSCNLGTCHCDPGWSGDACDVRDCQVGSNGVCSAHGTCWHGMCQCESGWTGTNCDVMHCPEDCNLRGVCVDGHCKCDAGWGGEACADRLCAESNGLECGGSHHGTCIRGHCVCEDGWKGQACESIACPGYDPAHPDLECSTNGTCINGACECDLGFWGAVCEHRRCPGFPDSECGGHGNCDPDTGLCECDRGWRSLDCSVRRCLGTPECTNNGVCTTGVCVCNAGWKGDSCNEPTCVRGGVNATECSSNGHCINGACACFDGWEGDACDIARQCPGDPECSDHGVCNHDTMTCLCHSGWKGFECNERVAVTGVCEGGSEWVECAPSHVPTCSNPDMPVSVDLACTPRCVCPAGQLWDKHKRHCVEPRACTPLACGAALKEPPADGVSVAVVTRPCNETSMAGSNEYLECACSGEPLTVCWAVGEDFAERHANNKRAVITVEQADAERVRDPAQQIERVPHLELGDIFTHDWASGQTVMDPTLSPLTEGEYHLTYLLERSDEDREAFPNQPSRWFYAVRTSFYASGCLQRHCPGEPFECSGNGVCVGDSCDCLRGWRGEACDQHSCDDGCGNGVCDHGVCSCEAGWEGPTCENVQCPITSAGTCNNHGDCVDGQCVCDAGFSGTDCTAVTLQPVCEGGASWVECGRPCTPTCTSPDCDPTAEFPQSECSAKCQCPHDKPWWDAELRTCVQQFQCPYKACGTSLRAEYDDLALNVLSTPCHTPHDGNVSCVCADGPVQACWKAGATIVAGARLGDPITLTLLRSNGTDLLPVPTAQVDVDIVGAQGFGRGSLSDGHIVVASPGRYALRLVRSDDTALATREFYVQDCTPEPECPSTVDGPCSGRGVCSQGTCVCDIGWTGDDCSRAWTCPGVNAPCEGHGVCEGTSCVCETGWDGPDCSRPACAHECLYGTCLDGKCHCLPGYSGVSCATDSAVFDVCLGAMGLECSGHGVCRTGVCACERGYAGMVCERVACPGYPDHECSGRGQCLNGECMCEESWAGVNCHDPLCPVGDSDIPCSGHGDCLGGQCICADGFMGSACEFRQCPGSPPCSAPNGECLNGTCKCFNGWKGAACNLRRCPGETMECTGQGDCINGTCMCGPGWKGVMCDILECPGTPECNGHGACHFGVCECNDGFTGLSCAIKDCTGGHSVEPCSGHGECNNGVCECEVEWTGSDCYSPQCPVSAEGRVCSDNGICQNGVCHCVANTTGMACGFKLCPADCSGNGQCTNGRCECDPNYDGIDCSIYIPVPDPVPLTPDLSVSPAVAVGDRSLKLIAPEDASVQPTNLVSSGALPMGVNLQIAQSNQTQNMPLLDPCPSNLIYTACAPLAVATCAKPSGRRPQSNLRLCHGGCVCKDGQLWDHVAGHCTVPEECIERRDGDCEPNCHHGGDCAQGSCQCQAGWRGVSCDTRMCPGYDKPEGECSGHGVCVNGECVCDVGYQGVACATLSCVNDCSLRGTCIDGVCECNHRYTGSHCQFKQCAIGSNYLACGGVHQGICNATSGLCRCINGHYGKTCSQKRCLYGCDTHGDCNAQTGSCECAKGWRGAACNLMDCPNDCSGRGDCDGMGQCHCFLGFTGFDCSQESCPKGKSFDAKTNDPNMVCSGKGLCVKGECHCLPTYAGGDCSVRTCPHNCSRHGRCDVDVCVCDKGYTGRMCEKRVCDAGCSGKGWCVESGECACEYGFSGPQCENRVSCPGDPPCHFNNGRCNETSGECICQPGFAGYGCEVQLPMFPVRVTIGEDVGTVPSFTECTFPFYYQDKEYMSCTSDGMKGVEWCSADRMFSGNWGRCAPVGTCPGDNGRECGGHGVCKRVPNTDSEHYECQCHTGYEGSGCQHRITRVVASGDPNHGRVCQLPFTFRGKTYNDCTADLHPEGKPWCMIADSPLPGAWGICAPRGTCPGVTECHERGFCDRRGHCTCDVGWEGLACNNHVVRMTTDNKRCVFPFVTPDGMEHHDCVITPTNNATRERAWCGLEMFVAPGKTNSSWGFCAERGVCPGKPQCSKKGTCENGRCKCLPGYSGPDCSEREHDLNHARQLSALRSLFIATNGAEWVQQGSGGEWDINGQYPRFCLWWGVVCDFKGRVVSVQLFQNGLDGTIPTELALLKSLVTLDLSHNHLTGTIPEVLGTLTTLKQVNLNNNRLTGTIPSTLVTSPSVETINLNNNYLISEGVAGSQQTKTNATLMCDDNCIRGSPRCAQRPSGCDVTMAASEAMTEVAFLEADDSADGATSLSSPFILVGILCAALWLDLLR